MTKKSIQISRTVSPEIQKRLQVLQLRLMSYKPISHKSRVGGRNLSGFDTNEVVRKAMMDNIAPHLITYYLLNFHTYTYCIFTLEAAVLLSPYRYMALVVYDSVQYPIL